MSRDQVISAIEELNHIDEILGKSNKLVGGGPRKRKAIPKTKARARYPYGYGGGLMSLPSQFGYGGSNIAGCNMYGGKNEYSSVALNAVLNNLATENNITKKDRANWKLEQINGILNSPAHSLWHYAADKLRNKIDIGRIKLSNARAKEDALLMGKIRGPRDWSRICSNKGYYPLGYQLPGQYLAPVPTFVPI